MRIKKIRYKNKIDFDYFEIWLGRSRSIFDLEQFKIESKVEDNATCVSLHLCESCVKKYKLSEDGIEIFEEELDGMPCGVDGCSNIATKYADIEWKDFKITEYER